MASRWTDVERVEQGALPTMLAQAVIAGTALTVGAIACSGFYLSMIGNVAALLPWATIVILIAVAFTYIVGFALLWCAEALTLRANDKLKPWLYGVVGLIGYGVWGTFMCWITAASSKAARTGNCLRKTDFTLRSGTRSRRSKTTKKAVQRRVTSCSPP